MTFETWDQENNDNKDNDNKDNDNEDTDNEDTDNEDNYNEDNDNEDNNNKDNDNEDYNNNHDHDEYRGPNCDVRAVLQFCDVFWSVGDKDYPASYMYASVSIEFIQYIHFMQRQA